MKRTFLFILLSISFLLGGFVSLQAQWTGARVYGPASFYVNSLEVEFVKGNPAILTSPHDRQPEYIRSTNSQGSVWPALPVYPAPNSRSHQLNVVNGNPAIAYVNLTIPSLSLEFMRSLDDEGNTWGSPVTVSTNLNAHRIDMGVVNGRPAIVYLSYSLGIFTWYYVRANDASGTSWGSPVDLQLPVSATHDPDMAIVNGNPAIWVNNYYVRANDADGTSWATPVQTSTFNNYWNPDCSCSHQWYQTDALRIVNGHPAIFTGDDNGDRVMYIRANDPNGNTWGTPVTVASGAYLAGGIDMEIMNGRPVATYRTSSSLVYIEASDVNGSAWGAPETVATSTLFYDIGVNLFQLDGKPAIVAGEVSMVNLHRSSVAVPPICTPEAKCKNVTVNLDNNGSATIDASMVDNSSTLCGGSLSLDITSFNCSNLSNNNIVNLSISGTNSYCTAVVTVTTDLTANAGADGFVIRRITCNGTNIMPAYTLTGSASGGGGTYTYTWRPSGGLSCTNCTSPVATPTATAAYTLTVRDGYGCTKTDEVVVTVYDQCNITTGCVNPRSCNKVYVCNGCTQKEVNVNADCNSANSLCKALRDGYTLGQCPGAPACKTITLEDDFISGDEGLLQAIPNPFQSSTTLEFSLESDDYATLEILDITGRTVATLFEGEVTAGSSESVHFTPGDLAGGMYIARLRTANGTEKIQRLILSR